MGFQIDEPWARTGSSSRKPDQPFVKQLFQIAVPVKKGDDVNLKSTPVIYGKNGFRPPNRVKYQSVIGLP
jgi:hypothetical protein